MELELQRQWPGRTQPCPQYFTGAGSQGLFSWVAESHCPAHFPDLCPERTTHLNISLPSPLAGFWVRTDFAFDLTVVCSGGLLGFLGFQSSGPVSQQGPWLTPGPRLGLSLPVTQRAGEAAETWDQSMALYLRVTLAHASPTAPTSFSPIADLCCFLSAATHNLRLASQESQHQTNVTNVSFLLRG